MDSRRIAAAFGQVFGESIVWRSDRVGATRQSAIEECAETPRGRGEARVVRQFVGHGVVRMIDDGPEARSQRDEKAFVIVRVYHVDCVAAEYATQRAHERRVEERLVPGRSGGRLRSAERIRPAMEGKRLVRLADAVAVDDETYIGARLVNGARRLA